jgi:branched-chain amino acid aminotransferase
MNADLSTIKIEKSPVTKIDQVNFDTLTFGSVFTDHMFECDYIDGQWQNPVIKPYQPIPVFPSLKVFHYGQAVFEGMKAYKDIEGGLWMFRPDQNQKRINNSAKRLNMPEFPRELFFEALNKLLLLDSDWAKYSPDKELSLYIRPFMIATQNEILATPSNSFKFMIILSPVRSYFRGEVGVVIAEKYSRAANGGTGAAKAAGNYAAQFYPTDLAVKKGYKQVIWTDDCTHTGLEEAGTMNVFFRFGDTLVTAPTSDRILDGVTRKSIIDLAKHLGIPVEVRPILVEELIQAAEQGELKEIFGAGTAAVVSPVNSFAYKGKEYKLPMIENKLGAFIKDKLTDIQYNRAEDPFGWRYKVQ